MSDWCPENDGAYRAELAAKARAMGEHTIPSPDALIRATLEEAANEIDCGKCYGEPCPLPGDCMNVLADEIRALADDPQALAAIKAKAEGSK